MSLTSNQYLEIGDAVNIGLYCLGYSLKIRNPIQP